MNLCVCTISFRHQLVSLEQIAKWAARQGFQGIELWGVHAQNLVEQPEYDRDWLHSLGLTVPMISDYLPVQGERSIAVEKTARLCGLTHDWGARKLRTFAGNKASHEVTSAERAVWVQRMRELCKVADTFGVTLVVETHPNTLADTRQSILQLAEEIDHPALRFNFDVIHVWEGGADPCDVFHALEPLVVHMHLKNVKALELVSVFAPPNVYAPSGSRNAMVPLFEGAFDYATFLRFVMTASSLWNDLDVSLEWFGPDTVTTLARDRQQLRALEYRCLKDSHASLEAAARLA